MWDVLHHSARCVVYISNNNKPGCIVEGYYSSTIPTSKQLCCDTFLVIVFISYLSPPPPVISTRWLLYNLVKKGRASADVILYVASTAKLSRFKFLNFHSNRSIELNHDISIFKCHTNVWTSTQKDQNRTCLPTIGNSLYVVQAMAGRVFLLLILEVPTSLKYGQEIKVFFMFGTFRSKRTRE